MIYFAVNLVYQSFDGFSKSNKSSRCKDLKKITSSKKDNNG